MTEKETILPKRIHDEMRFALSMNLAIVLSVFLAILFTVFLIRNQPATFFTGLGLALCLASAVGTYITSNYKVTGYAFAIVGPILVVGYMNFEPNGFHFADPLWLIIVALFTYFVLGKRVGTIVFAFEALGLFYFILFNLEANIHAMKSLSEIERYALLMNLFICCLVIMYLVHLFLKRNDIAVLEYENIMKELKDKNILVREQNREKTSMLKEIHHRVKNNLQVITSLLRLQSREIENQSSHSHFKEAIDRVSAMALIHNQMYQSKDLDRINLEPYLQSLSKNILHSYALEIPVDIQFDISLAHASSNNIVPMALIFNELMSNSLKHAFNEQTRGLITVEAYQSSDKRIEFIYADNGQWKPPEREDSFGMELIETLAEQLGGNVERNTEKGTKFTFIFESEYL